MSELITVRTKQGFSGAGLWERHPDHPGGEVFVAGSAVVQVARTPMAERQIRQGVLVVVPQAAAVAAPPPSPPTLTDVKGLGEKAAEQLAALGIETLEQFVETDPALLTDVATLAKVKQWQAAAKKLLD